MLRSEIAFLVNVIVRNHKVEYVTCGMEDEAEVWLHSTQAILEVRGRSDKEKIQCATFTLKKEARYWWRTVKERTDVTAMTWKEFVAEFNLKCFNSEMTIV